MKLLTLKRIGYDNDGTYGVVKEETKPFAITLEPPWLDNLLDISCIPSGLYSCHRISSLKFGETFEIKDVPYRTNILFHKLNFSYETKGCIGLAEKFEYYNGRIMIQESANAFDEFMRIMQGLGNFQLNILWC